MDESIIAISNSDSSFGSVLVRGTEVTLRKGERSSSHESKLSSGDFLILSDGSVRFLSDKFCFDPLFRIAVPIRTHIGDGEGSIKNSSIERIIPELYSAEEYSSRLDTRDGIFGTKWRRDV